MTALPATARLDIRAEAPDLYRAMLRLSGAVSGTGLDARLLDLVKLRASQINGCAYCLDMHSKDLRAAGEDEMRLHVLAAWREAPFLYSSAERAGLALCEALTDRAGLPSVDDAREAVAAELGESGLAALIFAIAEMNAWNRIAIGSGSPAGTYQPQPD